MSKWDQSIEDEERLKVCAALARRGVVAHHEYPGVVSVKARNGYEAWTGMHSWGYASWIGPDREPIEDSSMERFDAEANGLKPADRCPERVAEVWAACIEKVERWKR